MFKKILGLVTSPQIVIDAIDIRTDSDDWNEEALNLWINDIINFHIDMALRYGN